ncbi:MAG TPA: AAA family ATPase [Candidatus Binataceae bacterium]|nr:AAA family ATPase [Candidatus Binataceae bacterium]
MAHSRTVTLLFTNLVSRAAQPAKVDDEADALALQKHHNLLTEAISAAGGDELEWLGDGVLAAFNSTADAVRCAITIQQNSRRPRFGTPSEIRIGINLGEVFRRDTGYFGTPLVTARRLCDLGSSGQILCSSVIVNILNSDKDFEFRNLGDILLKGLASPVGVFEVVYQADDASSFVGSPASTSGIVTLLFTKLIDSNSNEIGGRYLQAHHNLITDAIAAFGGDELEWRGDGAMAAFRSAANAVQSAIRIQQTARRPISGARFEIGVGIDLGEVLRREARYTGTPLDNARRLCDLSSRGQILCSSLLADILQSRHDFEFRNWGELASSADSAPLGVSEVVYERTDPAAVLQRTPFVGRTALLERLENSLLNAINGVGSVAMLCGEPGIGKTRALDEFTERALEGGAQVLRGSCYDGEWQAPYGPFAEAVARLARQAPTDVAAAAGENAAVIARIVPALRDAIGDIPEPAKVDKEEERFRLFDAVSQFFIALSRCAPLVLILDDLHWADRGIIAMLTHVIRFVPAHPIMLIGAYRDTEVDRGHPLSGALADISRTPGFNSYSLEGFEGDDLAELLEMVADRKAPPLFVQAIVDATDGNPLFIREVLLHLLEEGKILNDREQWLSNVKIEELGIPDGVRQVIERRLSRLTESASQLLSSASAFNGAVPVAIVAAACNFDKQTALDAIDEAIEAQLVRRASDTEYFDFTHALIRQTLYSQINSVRRTRLHRKIAEEMEGEWRERAIEHAPEIAYQFWKSAPAKGMERGAKYALFAADSAEAAFDHYNVAAFLRIALDLLSNEDTQRPRLLARLGFALTWSLDLQEALTTSREAGNLIAAGEGREAATQFYEQMARAMFAAGLTRGAWDIAKEGLRYVEDHRDIAWASLTEIDINRAEAEDPTNPGILVDSPRARDWCETLRKFSHAELAAHNIDPIFITREEINADPAPRPKGSWRGGDLRMSLSLWQHEASECERRGALVRAMSAWAGVARCHIAFGDFADAQAAIDRAVALSRRIGRPSVGAVSLAAARTEFHIAMNQDWDKLLADFRNDMGQTDPAIGVVEVIRALGAEAKWTLANVLAYSACVDAYMGLRERSLRHLNELPAALELGAGWGSNYVTMALYAERTIWVLNIADHAEIIERNILSKILTPDFRWPSADSRLSLAHLCALQGRHDEAEGWFNKAREVLHEQGARTLCAMTDYDQALMYLRRDATGDVSRAAPYLDAALRQFRALGMAGWISSIEESRQDRILVASDETQPRLYREQ